MPKKGRDDDYWREWCNRLAAGEPPPSKTGWHPGGNSPWKVKIDKIMACGETRRRRSSNQSLLPFGVGIVTCTCDWDHDNQTTAAPAAAAAPQPQPQKVVDFGMLCKPTPRKIKDVRGKYDIKTEKGCYPLEVFGYSNGKCPHCKSPNIDATNVNNSVKLIYTSDDPRFVQGVGLKCKDCNGSQWQSYEKTYVDTLSKKQQNELNAVVSGKRNGVDMGLIIDMRLGATASTMIWFSEKRNPFQNANLREWCVYAISEYEKWRMTEVEKALKEKRKRSLPPLCETNYPLVSNWVKKMKELSTKVMQNGAFNADSSQLSSQLKSFTPTSSPTKNLNLGETTAAADLSVMVATAAGTSATKFPSPTSSRVQKGMEAIVSSKRKRTKIDPPSEEDLHRQKVAAAVMAKHGITADAATGRQKRCKVCGLIKKDFYFNKDNGRSTIEAGVPHFTTRSREKNFVFCPLADDHEIYYEHQRLCQEEKMQRNKRQYAENCKRGSKSM